MKWLTSEGSQDDPIPGQVSSGAVFKNDPEQPPGLFVNKILVGV